MSHEIRTPLTVIIGLSESLLKSSAFANDVHNKILGIYRNSAQLRNLISELLDFRKQEQGHTRIYVHHDDLALFLRETVMLFKEYATSNDIALELNVPTSMPMWFDRKQMMNRESDVLVALPGGIGTLDEVCTVMANTVIGIRRQPLVFYNVDGCWDAVLAALDNLFAQGLVSGQPADYYSVATSIDELRALL